jgi:hypothetical protein
VLETAAVLDRLCVERVLVASGSGYRFRYPLVRQVLQDTVSAGRRRLLQQRVRVTGAVRDRRDGGGEPPFGIERRTASDRRGGGHAGTPGQPPVFVVR